MVLDSTAVFLLFALPVILSSSWKKIPQDMMKCLFIRLIRFYQLFISPLKPPSCRFYPTCSEYALQAIEKYGAIRGSIFGVKRIMRCHPFSKGGYDPLK